MFKLAFVMLNDLSPFVIKFNLGPHVSLFPTT